MVCAMGWSLTELYVGQEKEKEKVGRDKVNYDTGRVWIYSVSRSGCGAVSVVFQVGM